MKRNSLVAAMSVAVVSTFTVGFVNITPKVIYGNDNRLEVYEVPRADIREVADSTVALIPSRDMSLRSSGAYVVSSRHYGNTYGLCEDERFHAQPSAANCSGFLVGEDLIATAGHCIDRRTCADYKFVFGFAMINQSTARTEIDQSEVYSCKEVVAHALNGQLDYALVKVDRPVRGHRPLKLQASRVTPGDDLLVIGHPAGIPTKVADGAKVRAQRNGYFVANLDTYGGNSGSAVFNANTLEVVGILVRGDTDFAYDRANKCTRSYTCTDSGCRGEDVTNISYIAEALKK